ncbi:MAG: glycoside hydrolase family 57 [Methylohalobius sp. ZOD2]
MMPIHHALVLNLHQPLGNLPDLWEHNRWEAKEILFAMDRIPRKLWGFEDVARVHLSLSGTLLETLSDPIFQNRVYGTVDVGSLLWHFQNTSLFEILGTAYYHPVLPLIPEADRKEQLWRWLHIGRHLFWRERFPGFWPPEMGFSMELIPLLAELGYRYVLVDSEHVEPVTPMDWPQLRYRPHIARYEGAEIVVVVRDRDLSNAQESGMEPEWFCHEVAERTRWCDFPPLVTTCTDGENGGWFRNVTQGSNFWDAFYLPMLMRARFDAEAPRPIFIGEYLDRYGAHGEVKVHSGAWNTGDHSGHGFTQWTGSARQKDGLAAIEDLSKQIHDLRWRAGELGRGEAEVQYPLEQALSHLLRAETSCHFYWGEAWMERAEQMLKKAEAELETARESLGNE